MIDWNWFGGTLWQPGSHYIERTRPNSHELKRAEMIESFFRKIIDKKL